ncbi:alternate F1F0 ATPase, F1 subunit alpha [Nodosilinea sp. P-1105]|uniref:alternate F1F0 ATPase, F1 subunit alpha n=1 Tax=Nodosilinea sp. P-1105 TaxID=2546229 RepID=UPI00146BD4A9|nr:alternate F1F0 ATPase, F1 subunit alpha [Nodosilinea sp. P-1105]NMF85732.1 alternate F1F0 ATPase, F1 subunit alpha [Nodosilinea sp. P-1105]
MTLASQQVQAACTKACATIEQVLADYAAPLVLRETGLVQSVRPGIARITGLPGVCADELVCFPRVGVGSGGGPLLGIAFNLDPEEVGVILLGDSQYLQAGDQVYRTERVMDVPVGEALLGRVITVMGQPLDGGGVLDMAERRPVEREAPAILDRAPVTVPLQTGLKVVDALIPIGRGQRELIIGDRQTGKTAIAIDTILNQADQDVVCIYCAIGLRSAAIARVIATLRQHGAMDYTVVVVAAGQDPLGLQYITPYGATTMAEYFMEQGRDVLIVYDDLTHHARTYRELSLLLRRPPGREAYPGDIFYLHSRLLERATHLCSELGGGSLTALPIIETQAQNLSAYIPTNLISITDGQIYLSPDLFQKSIFPAVDVGKSVSRVGGKTQLSAYQGIAGKLRLSYAQFQEVEVFARFGTQMDEPTRKTLERGRRIREVLKQPQSQPLSAAEQIAVLLAVTHGLLDAVSLDHISAVEQQLTQAISGHLPDLCDRIHQGDPLTDTDLDTLLPQLKAAIAP